MYDPKQPGQSPGRRPNLSCDPVTHVFMREVPYCWAMGQAAGVAAATAISAGVRVREVDVRDVQRQLLKQGMALHQKVEGSISREQTP